MQSLSLYILATIHRDRAEASEAGLKYFVLGALSSGLLLYGISLVYGTTGHIDFQGIAGYYHSTENLSPIAITGFVLIAIGVLFKVSAVPFHMWTPDVYQGSPTIIAAFFAICPKIAALALLTSLLIGPFGESFAPKAQQIIVVTAALSMLIGALGAIAQQNIKRLIAFSSIGHVGYILTGLAAGSQSATEALLLYLIIYAVMSLGLFAVILMLKVQTEHTYDINHFAGLAQKSPSTALTIAILMLSMAGIPPFAGFFAKFYVFYAAIEAKLYTLTIIGVASSVIAAYYYLRIIKIMYFDKPHHATLVEPNIQTTGLSLFSAVFNTGFVLILAPLLAMVADAVKGLF